MDARILKRLVSRPRAAAGILGACLLALWSLTGTSASAFSAILAGQAAAGSATLQFNQQYPNGASGPWICSSVPASGGITNAVEAISCPASIYPTTSAGTATDVLENVGTVPAAAVAGQVSARSCGPVQLSDAVGGGADPLLPRGQTTFDEPGPLNGGSAIGLDGITAFASNVQATSTGTLLGGSFTEGVWFKVARGYSKGGVLMGFGSSPTDGPEANYDRVLWMTTSGAVKFGIDGPLGTTQVVTSAGPYNDGEWHLAVASVASVVANIPTLYVTTGTVAASTTGVGVSALLGYSGYWHVGWDQLSPQWDSSASPFLAGDLADAFVIAGTALSSSQVTTLASEVNQQSWQAETASLGATDAWSLGGSGTSTYSSIPYGLPAPVCSYADIAWSFSNPAAVIATMPLSVFADGSSYMVPTPGPGTTETVAITLSHDPAYTGTAASVLPGLIIYAPVTLSVAVGSSAWHSSFAWAGARTPSSATSSLLM